uniref:Secreted protein n=1 Tax=Haemonchus placei TaxID=6290 RepID=A0A0N4X3J0_HAEPC
MRCIPPICSGLSTKGEPLCSFSLSATPFRHRSSFLSSSLEYRCFIVCGSSFATFSFRYGISTTLFESCGDSEISSSR